jgi:thiamine phosphate synthase YjbQ (UPF0047 family)
MSKRKRIKTTNNDIQNITHNSKDRVTRTGVNSGALEGYVVPASLVTPVSLP